MPQLNCDERAYARLLGRELKLKPAEICEKIKEMRRSWNKAAKVRPSLGQRVTCTASSVGKIHVDSKSSACPVPFFLQFRKYQRGKKNIPCHASGLDTNFESAAGSESCQEACKVYGDKTAEGVYP